MATVSVVNKGLLTSLDLRWKACPSSKSILSDQSQSRQAPSEETIYTIQLGRWARSTYLGGSDEGREGVEGCRVHGNRMPLLVDERFLV